MTSERYTINRERVTELIGYGPDGKERIRHSLQWEVADPSGAPVSYHLKRFEAVDWARELSCHYSARHNLELVAAVELLDCGAVGSVPACQACIDFYTRH